MSLIDLETRWNCLSFNPPTPSTLPPPPPPQPPSTPPSTPLPPPSVWWPTLIMTTDKWQNRGGGVGEYGGKSGGGEIGGEGLLCCFYPGGGGRGVQQILRFSTSIYWTVYMAQLRGKKHHSILQLQVTTQNLLCDKLLKTRNCIDQSEQSMRQEQEPDWRNI